MTEAVHQKIRGSVKQIDFKIPRVEYEPEFKKKLKEYTKKADLKGFRKGKTPIGLIRKQFGKAILEQVVFGIFEDRLDDQPTITDKEMILRLDPIPETKEFSVRELPDEYIFSFRGMILELPEVKGVDESTVVESYQVELSDEEFEDELEAILLKYGTVKETEEVESELALVTINAKELDEDKNEVKQNGFETAFKLSVRVISEVYKDNVIGMKLGERFQFNIHDIHSWLNEKGVREELLQLGEDETDLEFGDKFEGEIVKIEFIVPAEPTTVTFQKVLGMEEDEEAEITLQEFRQIINKAVNRESESKLFDLLKHNIIRALTIANDIELSRDFVGEFTKTVDKGDFEDQLFIQYQYNLAAKAILDRYYFDNDLEVSEEYFQRILRKELLRFVDHFNIPLDEAGELFKNLSERPHFQERVITLATTRYTIDKIAENLTIDPKTITATELKDMSNQLQKEVHPYDLTVEEAALWEEE